MKTLPDFDREAAYDREIAPLMARIIDVCKREGIPMVASFNYAQRGRNVGLAEPVQSYVTTAILGEGDRFPESFAKALASIRPDSASRN